MTKQRVGGKLLTFIFKKPTSDIPSWEISQAFFISPETEFCHPPSIDLDLDGFEKPPPPPRFEIRQKEKKYFENDDQATNLLGWML